MLKRIKLEYIDIVKIPKKFKKFFWDCPDGKVILEKYIYRLLIYGDFETIKIVYKDYPEETYKIAMKYQEIKRGVRYWIKYWYGKN